jgi:hypothetical protein
MAGYLDQYGAGDERRNRVRKWMVVSGGILALGVIVWWFLFVWSKAEVVRASHVARFVQKLRNHNQEAEIKQFLDLVANRQYAAAYKLWGALPRDYPFPEFMKDWGPQSPRNFSSYQIVRSRSCGSGVIVTVDFAKGGEENLWVQRSDRTLSFSPFPGCPTGG